MNDVQIKNSNADADRESPANAESKMGPVAVPMHDVASGARLTLRSLRAETEMQAISQALEQTGWNRKRAAKLLSISYRGLLYKIRQHNITRNTELAGVPKRAKMADTLDSWGATGLAVAGRGTPGKD